MLVHNAPYGTIDDRIGGLVTSGLMSDDRQRFCVATMLSLCVLACPSSAKDHNLRDDSLALNELLSEGSSSEIQTTLGWTTNARAFSFYLQGENARDSTIR